MTRERPAGFTITDYEIERAARDAGLWRGSGGGEGGPEPRLRRLPNDRIARHKRGTELPRRHRDREVERGDHGDSSDWARLGPDLFVRTLGCKPLPDAVPRLGSVEAKSRNGALHLAPGVWK